MLPIDKKLFVLFLQLAVLSRIPCKPIDTVQSSPWGENTIKSRLQRTQKSLDWTAGDLDDWLTPKPVTWKPWDPRTYKPITWDFVWPTWKPVEWKPIDWKPPPINITPKYKTDNTSLKVLIFVPTVFFCAVIFLCKHYWCKKDQNNTAMTGVIILPPPSPENTSPESRVSPSSQYSRLRNETLNTYSSSRTSPWTTHSSSINQDAGASSIDNVADKPPGYYEVVLSDMFKENAKFPDACPNPPDSPPPEYEEHLTRY